jgi:hypothetical protein
MHKSCALLPISTRPSRPVGGFKAEQSGREQKEEEELELSWAEQSIFKIRHGVDDGGDKPMPIVFIDDLCFLPRPFSSSRQHLLTIAAAEDDDAMASFKNFQCTILGWETTTADL